MAAGKYNILLEQGVTFQRTITWQDENNSLVNLSGAQAQFEMRDPQGNLLIGLGQTPNANGDVVTLGGAAGTITILISAASTSALKFGNARYELRITDSQNIVTRLLAGSVTLSTEVL